jgi:hypothetical protein
MWPFSLHPASRLGVLSPTISPDDRGLWERTMQSKILSLAAAIALLAGGAAHAQAYDGTPPYAAGGYGGYGDGGDCQGFTIAGVHAGVTVLGVNVGAGGRARIGGDCRGGGQAYAPQPAYQGGGYQGAGYGYQQQGYQDQGGGYYGQPQYAQPIYAQPQYAPAYAAPAAYGYGQQVYAQPAPCGCGQAYGYAPGY